jgi:EAL domain-containing protein (putative c-di-GMP-specific phosphodiesterase class I)
LGFELLARWRDRRRGLLLPADFEPLLSDQVIAPDLTRHMLGAAISAQRDLHRRGVTALRMAVNVTHFDLSDPSFVEETEARLAGAGLDWSSLELEVTERAILADVDHEIKRSLAAIRQRGGLVALDDFGTGHASLLHLRDWPIDVLKLDKEFVRRIAVDQKDEAIVGSIIGLARRLGLGVTAEGIETGEVAAKLLDMGCFEGQGYLYSAGVVWSEALRYIGSRAA